MYNFRFVVLISCSFSAPFFVLFPSALLLITVVRIHVNWKISVNKPKPRFPSLSLSSFWFHSARAGDPKNRWHSKCHKHALKTAHRHAHTHAHTHTHTIATAAAISISFAVLTGFGLGTARRASHHMGVGGGGGGRFVAAAVVWFAKTSLAYKAQHKFNIINMWNKQPLRSPATPSTFNNCNWLNNNMAQMPCCLTHLANWPPSRLLLRPLALAKPAEIFLDYLVHCVSKKSRGTQQLLYILMDLALPF